MINPLNNQSVKLAYDTSIDDMTFRTVGKLKKTSSGSGVIGKQFLVLSAGTGNEELIYVDLLAEPTLFLDNSGTGKENIYEYTGVKFGIESDDKTVPPTLCKTDGLKYEHKTGDLVEVVVSAHLFAQLDTSFTALTTTEPATAGEVLDSSSGNLGLSEHAGKYYKYNKFEKTITAVANNGSGKARFTSTAHGLSDGDTVDLQDFTETTYNVIGVIANKTADTFDVEAVTYVATGTGKAKGFDNYQGILLAGQSIAKDGGFTLYNTKSIVSGFTGLGESFVYVDNGGTFTTTSSSTTTPVGTARSGTELVQAERLPTSQVLTEAQATDPTSAVEGTVTGELLSKVGGNAFCNVELAMNFTKGDVVGALKTNQFASATTLYAAPFGDTSAHGDFRIPFIGSGVAGNSVLTCINKVNSPTDAVRIRIETDDGTFNSSGTLVDANATVDVVGSMFPTWQDTTRTTITFPASFTCEKGKLFWVVGKRTGAVDSSNYYFILPGTASGKMYLSRIDQYDGASWGNICSNRISSLSSTLFKNAVSDIDCIIPMDNTCDPSLFLGIVQESGVANASANVLIYGIDKNQSGLTKLSKYTLSSTRGGLSVGGELVIALSSTDVYISKNSPTTTFLF